MKTFLTLYFLYLVANMLIGVPENHVSAGVHQTVGPCNVTDVDLAGHSRQVQYSYSLVTFLCDILPSRTV